MFLTIWLIALDLDWTRYTHTRQHFSTS